MNLYLMWLLEIDLVKHQPGTVQDDRHAEQLVRTQLGAWWIGVVGRPSCAHNLDAKGLGGLEQCQVGQELAWFAQWAHAHQLSGQVQSEPTAPEQIQRVAQNAHLDATTTLKRQKK